MEQRACGWTAVTGALAVVGAIDMRVPLVVVTRYPSALNGPNYALLISAMVIHPRLNLIDGASAVVGLLDLVFEAPVVEFVPVRLCETVAAAEEWNSKAHQDHN